MIALRMYTIILAFLSILVALIPKTIAKSIHLKPLLGYAFKQSVGGDYHTCFASLKAFFCLEDDFDFRKDFLQPIFQSDIERTNKN
jgi:hypothetical protein